MSDLFVPSEGLQKTQSAPVGGKVGSVNLSGVQTAGPKWGELAQSTARLTAAIVEVSDDAQAAQLYNDMQQKLGDLSRNYANSPGRGSLEELTKNQEAANKIIAEYRDGLAQLGSIAQYKYTDQANKYITRYRDNVLNQAAKKADDYAKLNRAAMISNASEDYALAMSQNANSPEAIEAASVFDAAVAEEIKANGLSLDDPAAQNIMRTSRSKVSAQSAYYALAEGNLGQAWNAYRHGVKNDMFTLEDRTNVLARLRAEQDRREAKALAAAARAQAQTDKFNEKYAIAIMTGNFTPELLSQFRRDLLPEVKQDLMDAYKQLHAEWEKTSGLTTEPMPPTDNEIELALNQRVKAFVDEARNAYSVNGSVTASVEQSIMQLPADERRNLNIDQVFAAICPNDPGRAQELKQQMQDILGKGYNAWTERMTLGAEMTETDRATLHGAVMGLTIQEKLDIVSSKVPALTLRIKLGKNVPQHLLDVEAAYLVKEVGNASRQTLKDATAAVENSAVNVAVEVIASNNMSDAGFGKSSARDYNALATVAFKSKIRSELYNFINTEPELSKYPTMLDKLEAYSKFPKYADKFNELIKDKAEEWAEEANQ